jgi:hypothetical protein
MSAEQQYDNLVVAGVAFDTYVSVYAYVAEGIDLETALLQHELELPAWTAADAAWAARMAESAESDLALLEDYDRRLVLKQDALRRGVQPLDSDFRAWVHFQRRLFQDPDPLASLRSQGLRSVDLFRLQRAWSERLAADEALRAQLPNLYEEPLSEPTPLEIEPPKLVFPAKPVPNGPTPKAPPSELPSLLSAMPGVDSEAPPADPAGDTVEIGVAAVPPASTPSGPDTLELLEIPAIKSTPFVKAAPGVSTPVVREVLGARETKRVGSPDMVITMPLTQAPREPVLPFQSTTPLPLAPTLEAGPAGADGAPLLTLEQYASLTVELMLDSGHAQETLRRYHLTPSQRALLDSAWKEVLASNSNLRSAFDKACRTYHAWKIRSER